MTTQKLYLVYLPSAHDSTEYCDEVSEPPDYNASPSDSRRPLEPRKDSKTSEINFVSVESPPRVDDTSENGFYFC